MARPPGDRSGTRAQILGAAAELFSDRGYHATSLRDLAEHIGLSKAALHHHFPTKDELLDALLEPAFDCIESVIASAPAPPLDRNQARTLLGGYQNALLKAGSVMQVIDGDPSAVMRPTVRRRLIKHMQSLEVVLGGPDVGERSRLRARAALGVLHVTAIAHPSVDDVPHCHPMADDPALRREAVEAALDALGR